MLPINEMNSLKNYHNYLLFIFPNFNFNIMEVNKIILKMYLNLTYFFDL
jgi:hypothetical protein